MSVVGTDCGAWAVSAGVTPEVVHATLCRVDLLLELEANAAVETRPGL